MNNIISLGGCASLAGWQSHRMKEWKMLVNILLWAVMGGLAGWIASLIMGKDAQMGAIANIIVGIVGAMLGGWLMSLLGFADITGFNLYSLLVAILGAVVLLVIVALLRRVF
jgi:uncharacterized membrane protein YeaQ/YmgE (transglycosylase-associated protein family)